ncbi:MAG: transposase [Solirubrobacterales bacterium]|nr:transposase [Solirubrobacterales bacterium]MBV9714133.1 transposase [Solirubrobacterales bacterium]
MTEHGSVGINTPRDRDGSFEPRIVRKRQRRFAGSTTRSSRSTAAASPPGISSPTGRRSTGSRSVGISSAGSPTRSWTTSAPGSSGRSRTSTRSCSSTPCTEGARFWMQVLSELKQRGVRDILICCVDGLKGFPEAIEAIFPKTTVQPALSISFATR